MIFNSPFSHPGIRSFLFVVIPALFLVATPVTVVATNVLIETPLGNIELELLEEDAPQTVANFLNYIRNNRYDKAFMHRSINGFIIQGGGYAYADGSAFDIPSYPPVVNEFKVSNTRGTVAMAKLNDQPDSATSEWFINLADNSSNLDAQNQGFTVFARVVGDGMLVADAISELSTVDAGSPFSNLPVIDFSGNGALTEENLVMTVVTEISGVAPFVMNAGLNDAWFNPVTDGQGFFITVFPDLGVVTLAWFTYDTELPSEDAEANLGDPGHRWLTALGTIDGNTSVMTITQASGGLFDTATEIDRISDGTITLTFEDCNSGTAEYDIP